MNTVKVANEEKEIKSVKEIVRATWKLKGLGNALSAYAELLKTKQKDGVAVEHGESSKNS